MKKHVDFNVEIDDRLGDTIPADDELYLIGVSLFVFNRFYPFMIELLRHDPSVNKTWYELMDMPLKTIAEDFADFICRTYGINDKEKKEHVKEALDDLVERRNRIVHAFAVTDETGQALRTKTRHNLTVPEKRNQQFPITREYLQDFISAVKDMDYKLDDFREYLRSHGMAN